MGQWIYLAQAPWFNRYIVECKDTLRKLKDALDKDLIDTLWNVKTISMIVVDTWECRFNRYIGIVNMECKAEFVLSWYCKNLDLIDTLWNVKEAGCFVQMASD